MLSLTFTTSAEARERAAILSRSYRRVMVARLTPRIWCVYYDHNSRIAWAIA